jgi:hypothetical protein
MTQRRPLMASLGVSWPLAGGDSRWRLTLCNGLIHKTLVRVYCGLNRQRPHLHRTILQLKLMSTEHTGVPDDFAFDSPR